MNLNKIGVMLCLAFQESDGPFAVVMKYDSKQLFESLSKEDIKFFSDMESVESIDIVDPIPERRWIERLSKDRRKIGLR